jgi:hypothetical protein
LSGVAVVLAATAAVAGVTGTWSPCGLSMVETLGRHGGGRRTTLAACATFALGALAGGVVTFGGLALVGQALHAGIGSGALAVAAAVAACAAYAEARGLRVLPQIRRQVPEPWRRVMPLPIAAGLYGVLLGLGFTTFVLTVATWALAGLSLAIGEPWVGAVIGLAFGAGRALPVVLIAPRLGRPVAERLMLAMLERPRLLQALRLGDAIGLALVAVALSSTPALAAGVSSPATDPSTGGTALAWQQPGTGGFIRSGGTTKPVAGDDPALSASYLAYRNGDQATVLRRSDQSVVLTQAFAGLSKLAVSRRWLAVRVDREGGGDRVLVQRLEAGSQPFSAAATKGPDQLGRPALDGDRLVYVRSGPSGSRLVRINLGDDPQNKTILKKSDTSQYLSVAAAGSKILYVRSYRCGQALSLMDASGKNDRVITKGPGPAGTDGCGHGGTPTTFWTVALAPKTAYLTKLAPHKNGRPTPSIVSYGL